MRWGTRSETAFGNNARVIVFEIDKREQPAAGAVPIDIPFYIFLCLPTANAVTQRLLIPTNVSQSGLECRMCIAHSRHRHGWGCPGTKTSRGLLIIRYINTI